MQCCLGLLQEHIESENARLEREQQFWAKEIVVKIEYKYCPNLTIIDTPGGPWGPRAALCSHAAGCLYVALRQVGIAARACSQMIVDSCCMAYTLEAGSCMQQELPGCKLLTFAHWVINCCLEQAGSAPDMADMRCAAGGPDIKAEPSV